MDGKARTKVGILKISAKEKRPEGNSFLSYSPAGTVVLYVIVCLLYSRASFAMLSTNRNCSPATCWGLRFPKPSYGVITARFHSLCGAKGMYLFTNNFLYESIYSISTIFTFTFLRNQNSQFIC